MPVKVPRNPKKKLTPLSGRRPVPVLSARRPKPLLETLWKLRGRANVAAAIGIKTGAPTLGKPAIAQTHALAAIGVKTGVPTLGKPVIRQIHILTARGVAAGAPTLGRPRAGLAGSDQIAPLIMAARSRDTRMQHHIATRK